MKNIEELSRQLRRLDVGEVALVSDRLPCVRVGEAFKPVNAASVSTDEILALLVVAGGSRYVDRLGPRTTQWTYRLDGCGHIAVSAILRSDGRVQARFIVVKRDPFAIPAEASLPPPPPSTPPAHPMPRGGFPNFESTPAPPPSSRAPTGAAHASRSPFDAFDGDREDWEFSLDPRTPAPSSAAPKGTSSVPAQQAWQPPAIPKQPGVPAVPMPPQRPGTMTGLGPGAAQAERDGTSPNPGIVAPGTAAKAPLFAGDIRQVDTSFLQLDNNAKPMAAGVRAADVDLNFDDQPQPRASNVKGGPVRGFMSSRDALDTAVEATHAGQGNFGPRPVRDDSGPSIELGAPGQTYANEPAYSPQRGVDPLRVAPVQAARPAVAPRQAPGAVPAPERSATPTGRKPNPAAAPPQQQRDATPERPRTPTQPKAAPAVAPPPAPSPVEAFPGAPRVQADPNAKASFDPFAGIELTPNAQSPTVAAAAPLAASVATRNAPIVALAGRTPGIVGTQLAEWLGNARRNGASDVHIVAGRPLLLRVAGELVPSGAMLAREVSDTMLRDLVPPSLYPTLDHDGSCDFALEHPTVGRCRVNVSSQRTGLKGSFRLIPAEVPTLESLGLPPEIASATRHHQGIIVVTGPTGHGKTTTLAAIIDIINRETTQHVITVEDPVEYVHPRKRAMMSQREVGTHTRSFQSALKGSLREDPDVIVVGELRDTETVRMAIAAGETGHLVLGTMNTPSAAKTIDRIIDLFPPADQPQVRLTLAGGLRLIVGQRLVPNADRTAMVAAAELLPGSLGLWNLIRENKTFQIPSLQQRGRSLGIIRLDDSLADLVRTGRTSVENALAVAEAPDELEQALNAARGPAPLPIAPPKGDGLGGLFGRAGGFFGKKGG